MSERLPGRCSLRSCFAASQPTRLPSFLSLSLPVPAELSTSSRGAGSCGHSRAQSDRRNKWGSRLTLGVCPSGPTTSNFFLVPKKRRRAAIHRIPRTDKASLRLSRLIVRRKSLPRLQGRMKRLSRKGGGIRPAPFLPVRTGAESSALPAPGVPTSPRAGHSEVSQPPGSPGGRAGEAGLGGWRRRRGESRAEGEGRGWGKRAASPPALRSGRRSGSDGGRARSRASLAQRLSVAGGSAGKTAAVPAPAKPADCAFSPARRAAASDLPPPAWGRRQPLLAACRRSRGGEGGRLRSAGGSPGQARRREELLGQPLPAPGSGRPCRPPRSAPCQAESWGETGGKARLRSPLRTRRPVGAGGVPGWLSPSSGRRCQAQQLSSVSEFHGGKCWGGGGRRLRKLDPPRRRRKGWQPPGTFLS